MSTAQGLFAAYSYNFGAGGPIPQVAWDVTTSKLIIGCCYPYSFLAIAYSTNDGASWQLDSVKALSNGQNNFFGMNPTSDGNFAMGIGLTDQNASRYCTPAFVNNKFGTGTPDYIGYSAYTTSGSNVDYIRIA